jgi:hypothetical protein
MWGIPDQRPSRGSIGVAHTEFGKSGRAEAGRTLAEDALNLLHARPPDRAYQQQTDALAPEHLTSAIESKVASFLPGTPPAEQLCERLKILMELQARTTTATYRQVAQTIELVVAESAAKLREALAAAFDANPVTVNDALAHVRDAIGHFTPPATEASAALKRLDGLVQKLHDLPGFDERLTTRTAKRVSDYLTEEARAEAARAIHEVLQMLTADALRRHLPTVTAALRDLEERSVRYQQQLTAFRTSLTEQVQMHHREEQDSASSVAVLLPGPSQHEIVGALLVAKECGDKTTLLSQMIAEFEVCLRERASRSSTHATAGMGLPSLMLLLPYTELAAAWIGLLDSVRRVPGFSLYERLGAFGLDAAADQLWELAAPTCFFAGRDHEVFGVNVQEIAVIALPPACGGPGDERIRGELAQRFRAKAEDNCCHVTDGAGSELTVARIKAGFPIGIEHANHALLQSYVAAGTRGHLPHLVGIVSDSELGRPSAAHVALLRNQSPANGNTNGDQS